MADRAVKPLNRKAYGHIAHLPGSRLGPGDHACHVGQARICLEKARDRHDVITVQEKLDGTNVAVAKLDGRLLPLIRAGYLADASHYEQHRMFARWVRRPEQWERFWQLLQEGEWVSGEWLAQAHGTRYRLPHEPFVAFDLFRDGERVTFARLAERSAGRFVLPALLHTGGPCALDRVLAMLEPSKHGALDRVEGAVWRVERHGKVDFLAKYVRPDKVDGAYLADVSGQPDVWNWRDDADSGSGVTPPGPQGPASETEAV